MLFTIIDLRITSCYENTAQLSEVPATTGARYARFHCTSSSAITTAKYTLLNTFQGLVIHIEEMKLLHCFTPDDIAEKLVNQRTERTHNTVQDMELEEGYYCDVVSVKEEQMPSSANDWVKPEQDNLDPEEGDNNTVVNIKEEMPSSAED